MTPVLEAAARALALAARKIRTEIDRLDDEMPEVDWTVEELFAALDAFDVADEQAKTTAAALAKHEAELVSVRLCPEAIVELDRRAEGKSRAGVFEAFLLGTMRCEDAAPAPPLPDCANCHDAFDLHAMGHAPCIARCTCNVKLGEKHAKTCEGCRCALYVEPKADERKAAPARLSHWDKPRRKPCPIGCACLCHDTGGSGHDHHGLPCPGKAEPARLAAEEARLRKPAAWPVTETAAGQIALPRPPPGFKRGPSR